MASTAEYRLDRYRTLAHLGLCVECGRTESRPGRRTCLPCAMKSREKSRKQREARKLAQQEEA